MPELSKPELFSMEWLKNSGVSILITILIAAVLYLLLRHFVPPLVKRAMARGKKKQLKKETEKRANTLSAFFVNTGAIIIAIFAIFTILPEFGVNVAAMLTGLGIVGIAVGFGAQHLIRDVLSGIFIFGEKCINRVVHQLQQNIPRHNSDAFHIYGLRGRKSHLNESTC